MYKHLIILGSAYSIGRRICLHYVLNEKADFDIVDKDIEYVKNKCKNALHLSFNYIQTDDVDWDSVVKHDGYFKNIKVIDDVDEFINLLDEDRFLNGLDVAQYILTLVPCTHLKLEKLVYLCYADYVCKYNRSLFTDRIYAYRLGPIISSVYKKYKKKKDVLYSEEDNEVVENNSKLYLPIKSRIMASKYGSDIIFSIDDTIKKYGNMSAYDLVSLTHKNNSPWSIVGYDENEKPKLIVKDVIMNYHKYEEI